MCPSLLEGSLYSTLTYIYMYILKISLGHFLLFIKYRYVYLYLYIEGDTTGGFTIFYPDEGLDTGNILLTRWQSKHISY